MERFYPIGVPGQPWTDVEKTTWRAQQSVQRSYHDEVRSALASLDPAMFTVTQYGALSIDPKRYPLYAIQTAKVIEGAPWALVTGGVHGYETSGVQGALAFVKTAAARSLDRVNLVVAPCVSPWGYEVINRWNPQAVDPNRSFVTDSPSEEAAALTSFIHTLDATFSMHIDLHETTDTDESEFRPALAARDGDAYVPGIIPDGFYTVGDTHNPQPAFQAAIIAGVQAVTHIAPPDDNGQIIGADVLQPGVIEYPFKPLGLCAGLTDAPLTTTTEVYPDSPRATAAICNAAQVAAVEAGLAYLLARGDANT